MKETELQNTSETSKTEVQNLSAQDKARKHRKTAKAAISFIVMILLLVALFFAAVNIGSLKVSFPELLKGLFVEYNEDVATIYDLRFPRIVISMLAGAAIAVSGVLFQAVLKNPLADPGIIGISSGASFCGSIDYRICTDFIFLHSIICISWRCDCICLSLQPVMERGIKSSENHPCRCGGGCDVYGTFQCIKLHERWEYVRCGSHRQWKYHHEDMG